MATHTALVTGSGRNIGRAIALELAGQGLNLVVNSARNPGECEAVAEEVRGIGAHAIAVVADVGTRSGVQQIARAAEAAFGGVDVVVNNAAILPEIPFLELTDEDWHRVLSVDLHAAFYTSQAFLPHMIRGGFGRIVNITGMNAIHGYVARTPVSVAKHGLWGLTKSLAKEFGPKGVTVNAISPGPIATVHAEPELMAHNAAQLGRIPLGRFGLPEEVAALCGFLVSERGGFVSGQMIACNGAAQT
jgi:3-oxoacyl-[acyl-carrier protein] reductase